ncbi:MAG: N-acetylmuramoyl-L-alanine amidase [Deltaproteobacteria bacterium]|nr:N-acetylmuramoyl-L-alanine amidase [Deltaproteobacteria bacterium]
MAISPSYWKTTKTGICRILLFLIGSWACFSGGGKILYADTGPGQVLKNAEGCRKLLYESRDKMKYRHNWTKCVRGYTDLVERFPKSNEAVWGLYRLGQMHVKLFSYSGLQQDLDEAVEFYRRLSEEYPKHRLADDAQYKIGEIYYDAKNDLTQAYVEFLKVDIKFPSGDMRPKARVMLDKLSAVLSKRDSKKQAEADPAASSALTKVEDIRHWSTPSYTRVVVDLERPVTYEHHLLKEDPKNKKSRRLYLDLMEAYVSSDIETSLSIRDGLLKGARAGQYDKNTVRVVLDIDSIGGYKIFRLHDPFRIVVDVRGVEDKEEKAATQKAESEKAEGSAKKERVARRGIRRVKKPDGTVSLARQLGLNVRKIVIDPGHGGKDPGCFFKGGIQEKNIVLKLAKILAEKVEERLGCEAVLTRTKDVFIPLEKRTAFANVQRADLFVSLHINAHKQADVFGLETYFLNMATDERAVMVAARENATSEKNISDLQTILNDLMLNTKISESSKLAYEVQEGIMTSVSKGYRKVKNLGVKQAPFYVLIGAEMPAILIETGFITNPTERKRLLSDAYLERLSEGITQGISDYMKSIEQAAYKGG